MVTGIAETSVDVLIVEDEESIRSLLDSVFREEGYATSTARDGREGVDSATEQDPAVIVTDNMMPNTKNGSGIADIAEAVVANGLSSYILAMTADPTRPRAKMAGIVQSLGADRIITVEKPFDLDTLVAAVGCLAARRATMLGLLSADPNRTLAQQ